MQWLHYNSAAIVEPSIAPIVETQPQSHPESLNYQFS
jgi:hypothetical protein